MKIARALWGTTLVLAAALGPVSCGKTGKGVGDETHFQACKSQNECDVATPGFACIRGYCRPEETDARTMGDSIEDAGANGQIPDPRNPRPLGAPDAASGFCPPGCAEITGIPKNEERGCFERERAEVVACDCKPAEGRPSGCYQRTDDGSVWSFAASDGLLGSGDTWKSCPEEVVLPDGLYACEFEHCEAPPQSLCTVEQTCKEKHCGSWEYAEDGCRRHRCAAEADCGADERCVAVGCIDTYACASVDGQCGCSGPQPCITDRLCNSVAEYGPRGDFIDLTVSAIDTTCEPGQCEVSWTLTLDGNVTGSATGSPPTTHSATLFEWEIRQLVDGAELRLALRDGLECDAAPADVYAYFLELRTSEGTLKREFTGCVQGPESNPFRKAWFAVGAPAPQAAP